MKLNSNNGITYALSKKEDETYKTYSSLLKAITADDILLTTRQLMKIIQHNQAPTDLQMNAICSYLKKKDWRELYVFKDLDLLDQLVKRTLQSTLDYYSSNGILVFQLNTKPSYRTICSYFFTKFSARQNKINIDLLFSKRKLKKDDIKDATVDQILNLVDNEDWKNIRQEIINRMPDTYSEAAYHHSFKKALLLVSLGYI